MGYLICEKCKGYYKLKPGENQEDFTDTCACGGKLRYAVDIDVVDEKKQHSNFESGTSNDNEKTINSTSEKSEPSFEKGHISGEWPLNRKWILIVGVLFLLFGGSSLFYGIIGILTLILGVFLFFSDSWVLYFTIFVLWTFGGISALLFSISSIINLIAGLVIIMTGAMNLIALAKDRKENVSGEVKIKS